MSSIPGQGFFSPEIIRITFESVFRVIYRRMFSNIILYLVNITKLKPFFINHNLFWAGANARLSKGQGHMAKGHAKDIDGRCIVCMNKICSQITKLWPTKNSVKVNVILGLKSQGSYSFYAISCVGMNNKKICPICPILKFFRKQLLKVNVIWRPRSCD